VEDGGRKGSRREYGGGWWEEGGHGESMVEDGGEEGGHGEGMVEDGGRKGVTERIWWRMVGGRWSWREYGGRWWEEGGHVKFMDLYLAGGSPGPPLANIVVYGRLSP
jgi:hypothetical protein